MILNDALKRAQLALLDRDWRIGVYSANGTLLAISGVTHLKAPVHFPVIRSGVMAYALIAEDQRGVSQKIKDYSVLIKEMRKKKKSKKEILIAIEKAESEKYEITLTVGTSGADLNVGNVHLLAGSNLSIDTINLQI